MYIQYQLQRQFHPRWIFSQRWNVPSLYALLSCKQLGSLRLKTLLSACPLGFGYQRVAFDARDQTPRLAYSGPLAVPESHLFRLLEGGRFQGHGCESQVARGQSSSLSQGWLLWLRPTKDIRRKYPFPYVICGYEHMQSKTYSELDHSFWKSSKMSHLSFPILAFSTIFCPFEIDRSGNAVWPKASLAMLNETFSVIFKHCAWLD